MLNKIVGNDQIKGIFKRLLAANRLPNSLLLVGEEGVGKKAFALEIAKSFVCLNLRNGEACDECRACLRAVKFDIPKVDESTKVDEKLRETFRKVFFSEHPDIGKIVSLKKNILVGAIRNLELESNFLPYEAKARFFIIDDAERMNDESSNALLKTLEEPTKTSHIFLITAHPAALLPTIRSRCQIVRFAPIEKKEIESHLLSTQKFAHDDAALLAHLSRGSIGRALSLDLQKFREQRETMMKVLDSLVHNRNRTVLLKTTEEINDAKNKDFYEDYMEILQTLIHDVWTLRLGKEEIVNVDLRLQLLALAKDAHLAKLAAWTTNIETLYENLAVNLNKKIATDALFMQMANA